MEFGKFKGTPGTFLTCIRAFERAYDYNKLPPEHKGEWLISLLEGKAQEAVKMIQEPRPSYEKVKSTLELLYYKPKDSTTRLMELDNLKSSDYETVAEFAHDLMVKAAEAYPQLTGEELDRIVMAKLLRGLPKKTRERFDSSLYATTTLLVQSIQQAEELEKIDAPSDTVLSGKKGASRLVKPVAVAEVAVVCAPVACTPAPDATVRALAAIETRLEDSDRRREANDRRQEDRSRQMTQDIDKLARDYSERRPQSPYRPTSSLSNLSAISRDSDRSVSRSSEYSRGRSPGRETPKNLAKGNWVSLQETQARMEQARQMRGFDKASPAVGGRYPDRKPGNYPPRGYTGGYRGNAFNPRIWEAQQAERREWRNRASTPLPPPVVPPGAPPLVPPAVPPEVTPNP
jgi:hypothetical protein